MCQLLGMNCATPTDFSFSFRGFCQRGGSTDIHAHGWGIVIYEGRGLRTFLDTEPACSSPVAKLVAQYPMKTYNMMAHVRYATQGTVCLENVHPFSREMWGIHWTFCHNGEVPKFSDDPTQHPVIGNTQRNDMSYFPVGDTDSEAVFCAILNALRSEFKDSGMPTLPVLHKFIKNICDEIIAGRDEDTIFNFLLGCGQFTQFAYSWPGKRPGSKVWNGLYYIVREPPFSTANLIDCEYSIDFDKVTTPQDRVAVITTKPLTNEAGWKEFKRGELLMFDHGKPYSDPEMCLCVEMEGRGLQHSKAFRKMSSSTTPVSSPPSSCPKFEFSVSTSTATTSTTATQCPPPTLPI